MGPASRAAGAPRGRGTARAPCIGLPSAICAGARPNCFGLARMGPAGRVGAGQCPMETQAHAISGATAQRSWRTLGTPAAPRLAPNPPASRAQRHRSPQSVRCSCARCLEVPAARPSGENRRRGSCARLARLRFGLQNADVTTTNAGRRPCGLQGAAHEMGAPGGQWPGGTPGCRARGQAAGREARLPGPLPPCKRLPCHPSTAHQPGQQRWVTRLPCGGGSCTQPQPPSLSLWPAHRRAACTHAPPALPRAAVASTPPPTAGRAAPARPGGAGWQG